MFHQLHRPKSYSTIEPGLNDIFIQFHMKALSEWYWSFYENSIYIYKVHGERRLQKILHEAGSASTIINQLL